ncbi:competence protein CelB [Streptococcus pneumoniae]|nr:competence protein CelB [Streptococcus pneumoniae]CJC26395.1 competence protein CelB [Streptococcus pneumoniae]CJD38152.1 competence protein CelB [Streptococcus pneumoniae]CJD92461.1 competence protein CelB [Streptococcus pneumoniae]CJE63252.1 competence protein CelB [Streptococcus pneumoniae]
MEAIIEKIKEYKIIVICTGLGLLVGGFFLLKPAPQTPVKETNLQAEVAAVSKDSSTEKEVNKEEPLEQDLITVDVKGAVKSPGIYDLPVGSRVNDAVQKAGGLTEQADSKSLNLAQKVSDEALVYVLTKGEESASQQAGSGAPSSTSKDKKVNLNRASLEELKQVKGLGGKRAQDIIDHRETNGKFKKEHVGDLSEVTKAFHVGEILVSKDSLKQKEFVAELQVTQTKVRNVTAGENLPIFGSQLEVLSPRKIGDGDHEDSLVLYGKLLDKYFLFTGNLEEKGERDLLKHYPDLEVDVLKAGQHGSKKSSSSAFLEKLKPELTLISVGKNNRTKLPHQETLTRLEGINSQVYRTDQQGAIRFKGLDSWKIESVR